METERQRIIRLFAEGRITACECAELLDAVADAGAKNAAGRGPCNKLPVPLGASRRHVPPQAPGRSGSSAWAVALCIVLVLLLLPAVLLLPVLALVALPLIVIGVIVLALRCLKWLVYLVLGALILTIAAVGLAPLVLIAFPVLATVYWLCTLIACMARDVNDFGVLVPSDPALDKFLWILLVLFTWAVGALAYHLVFRHRTRPAARQVA